MATLSWSLLLPRPLTTPNVMTLSTLADARALIDKHLPAHFRDKRAGRHVATELDKAVRGGDIGDVTIRSAYRAVCGVRNRMVVSARRPVGPDDPPQAGDDSGRAREDKESRALIGGRSPRCIRRTIRGLDDHVSY